MPAFNRPKWRSVSPTRDIASIAIAKSWEPLVSLGSSVLVTTAVDAFPRNEVFVEPLTGAAPPLSKGPQSPQVNYPEQIWYL
jgi:hypothetical protein